MKFKRVGSKEFGYVDIPEYWAKFQEIAQKTTDLQYSDTDASTILTMNIFDTSKLSKIALKTFNAEEAAKHVWANLENHGASSVEGSAAKIGDYDAFFLYATYANGAQLAAWLFDAED